MSGTCEDDLDYLVDRDDDIDINDLVIKMLLMSDENPTHFLLQAASVGEWRHGYHVGNDVLCVCNGNGVELDDPSQLLLQAASVGVWHIHKEGNVWLEDDNFTVQCVSE